MEFRPETAAFSTRGEFGLGTPSLERATKNKIVKRLLLFVVAFVIGCSAIRFGVFHAGASDYKTPENSIFLGKDIGGLNTVGLKDQLTQLSEKQYLVEVTNGQTELWSLKDMGISFSVDGVVEAVSSGDTTVWEVINNRSQLHPQFAINQNQLALFAKKTVQEYAEPIDAKLVVIDGRVEMVPHKDGVGLSVEYILDVISSLNSQTSGVVLFEGTTIPARIQSDNVSRIIDKAQEFINNELEVVLGDVAVRIPHESIYVFRSVFDKATLELGYDNDKLREVLQTLIKDRTDNPWNELYSIRGAEKLIVRQGREGVSYEGLEEALLQASSIGPAVEDPQVFLQKVTTPYVSLSLEDAQPRIDVNLTTKRMTLIEKGKEQAVFPISGGKEETPTPTGEFRITSKTRKMTMSGPGYATPNVEYISWFKYNFAIHSAYWHDKFGQENVSLGCVNAKTDNAKYVYEWAPIGTPVSIHW